MGSPDRALKPIAPNNMKRRKSSSGPLGALFILGLVLSITFTSCLAGRIGMQQEQQRQRQIIAQGRQADSGLLTTIISLGLKYGPTLFNAVFGGSPARTPNTDRIEEIDVKEEDPLSTSNL